MQTRLIIPLLLTLALSCTREPQPVSDPEGIVLDIYVEDVQTKASRNGDGALNENVIAGTVDIFFYDETTLEVKKEALGAVRSGTLVQIQTNPNDLEGIFGTLAAGAHCGIFVVANYSGSYQGTPGSRTITQVKNSLLPAPDWETLPQTSFVMTGEQQLTLGNPRGATPVYASIGLERVAAKVTFEVTVSENITGENAVWRPDTRNMSVYMVYAMREASLGAQPVAMPINENATYGAGERVIYSQYQDRILYDTGTTRLRPRGENADLMESPIYSTTHNGEAKPFYTYPVSWETGSSMEPYLKMIIPWTYGNTTRKYYYKIPFHGKVLERNHWYHISIDVQILGTEQADPPAVGITYGIAPWSGSMDESSAQDITSETSIPATVITTRYLTIPTTEFILYNQEELVIPLQSSHDVEVVGFEVSSNAYQATHQVDDNYVGSDPRIYNPFSNNLLEGGTVLAVHPDYSSSTITSLTHTFSADAGQDAQGWALEVSGRESISFSHPLNRDLTSSTYDVAPYSIRFRVRHQGDASGYYVDVTIEQRPSIMIRPHTNSGGNAQYGYAFVNGGQNNASTYGGNWTQNGNNYRSSDNSWTGYPYYQNSNNSPSVWNNWSYFLGSAPASITEAGNNNANANMYVIETTVLPSSNSGDMAGYVLGDPRSRTIDNLPGSGGAWSQSRNSVTGETRRLSYYYPAGDAAYDHFIAPKLRIASSYGSTYTVTFENARRRCASYQEDGLPAGRWRLPTVAEIEYIALLNTDGKIFHLLGSPSRYEANGNDSPTTDYWCNSGFMTVYNGTNSEWTGNRVPSPEYSSSYEASDLKYVRCVYDDWYWEKTTYATLSNRGTFTWGDQDRSDVTIEQ